MKLISLIDLALLRPIGQCYGLRGRAFACLSALSLSLQIATHSDSFSQPRLSQNHSQSESSALASGAKGSSEIKRVQDDDRARQAFNIGKSLREEWKEASLKNAIQKFIEASEIWRASRSPKSVDALREAADVYYIFGDHANSLQLNEKAWHESQRLGDLPRSVGSRIAVARNTSHLGKNEVAKKYLESVLSMCSSRKNESLAWRSLTAQAENAMGEVYYAMGNSLQSLEYFKRAIAVAIDAGDQPTIAQARVNFGYAASNSGRQQEALEQFNQAARIYTDLGDQRGQALCLTANGSIISFDGKEEEALVLHANALKTFQTIGAHESEGVTLNAMGQAFEDLGQRRTALDKYLESLQVLERNQNWDFALVSQYKVARAYKLLGEVDTALVNYNRCLTQSRKAKNRRFEAYAMKDIAEIYHGQGRDRDTLNLYQSLLSVYHSAGDSRGEALIFSTVGDFFTGKQNHKSALENYLKALELFRKVGDRDEELSTLFRLGKAASEVGLLKQSLSWIEESIQLIETLRNYLVSPDMRASYFSSLQLHYELYIKLLMESEKVDPGSGFAERALSASESVRARTLVEMLAESGTRVGENVDQTNFQQHQLIQETLLNKERRESQLAGTAAASVEVAQLEREVRQLVAQEQSLQAQIRLSNPQFAELVWPQPLKLEQIQAELKGEDTLLLEFFLGATKSYLWAVTEDSFTSYELPPKAEIEALSRKVYESLIAPETSQAIGYQDRLTQADADYELYAPLLSQKLLGPVSAQLGTRRLLVVADGILQYVPFDALPQPNVSSPGTRGPLLENEIVSLPSLSTLSALRRQAVTPTGQKLIAVFADPVFNVTDIRVRSRSRTPAKQSDESGTVATLRSFAESSGEIEIPRLPFTRTEANRILQLVPVDEKLALTDFAANRSGLLQAKLSQYQIIHFATHALIDSERPRLSGIFLSTIDLNGQKENGLIALNDIYNLKLSAKLVVLSACNTGLGKDMKGEGLIGLTRGFMHAGSKSVVASLWKVDDHATAELMNRFYKGMFEQKLTPAAALKAAKLSLRQQKRWASPYYWAGFVLLGEYREQISSETTKVESSTIMAYLLLAGMVVGALAVLKRRVFS